MASNNKSKKDGKAYEEAWANLSKNVKDPADTQSKAQPQAQHMDSKKKEGGSVAKKKNEKQTQLAEAAKPEQKNMKNAKPSEATGSENRKQQAAKVGEFESNDRFIHKYETETHTLIEHCRFLAQQLKKSTRVQPETDFEQNKSQSSVGFQEYASQLKIIQDRNISIEEKLSNTIQKLTVTEKELNQTKIELSAASEKLIQAERREMKFNYEIESKTKEFVALSSKVQALESIRKELNTQLQTKSDSYEKFKNTVSQITKEKVVVHREGSGTNDEEVSSLKATIKLLTSQRDNAQREINSLNMALDKKDLEQKVFSEKSDAMTRELSQAKRKLVARAEKLTQAEKREFVLKSTIETKNKELLTFSEKVRMLDNKAKNLSSHLEQKQCFIEKLNVSLHAAQKDKKNVEWKVSEIKAKEINGLKKNIEALSVRLNISQKEVDSLNKSISAREVTEKAIVKKTDSLSEHITKLETELNSTKEKLVKAEKREFEHNQTIQKHQKELSVFTSKVTKLDETRKELSSQLQKKTESIEELNTTIRKVQKEKIEFQKTADSASNVEEMDRLKKTVEQLATQRDDRVREIESLNTALNQKVEKEKAIVQEIDTLKKNLSTTERKVSSTNKKLETSKKREEELKSTIESKHKEFLTLSGKFVSLESSNKGLSNEIQEKHGHIGKLNKKVHELQAKIVAVERHNSEVESEEISRLNKTIEMFTKQREASFTEIEQIKLALSRKESNEKLLVEKSKVLTSNLKKTEESLRETSEKIVELENREISLKHTMESKTKELVSLSEKVSTLETTHQELTTRIEKKDKTIEQLYTDACEAATVQHRATKDVSDQQVLVSSLTHERNVAHSKLKRHEIYIGGLNDRIERLLRYKEEQHEELQAISLKVLQFEEEKMEWESKFHSEVQESSILVDKIKHLESSNRDLLVSMQSKEASIRELSMILANWNNEMELTLSEFS